MLMHLRDAESILAMAYDITIFLVLSSTSSKFGPRKLC